MTHVRHEWDDLAMSTSAHEHVPALTLGWRLKMSLADSGLSRDDMAHELGVTPSTISRWMGDKGAPPPRGQVAMWAHLTRVPRAWLEHGVVVEDPDPGQPGDVVGVPDAVSRLADRKRSRTRGPTTQRYLPAAA